MPPEFDLLGSWQACVFYGAAQVSKGQQKVLRCFGVSEKTKNEEEWPQRTGGPEAGDSPKATTRDAREEDLRLTNLKLKDSGETGDRGQVRQCFRRAVKRWLPSFRGCGTRAFFVRRGGLRLSKTVENDENDLPRRGKVPRWSNNYSSVIE